MPILCMQGSVEERITDMLQRRQTGSDSQAAACAAVSSATATAGHQQVYCIVLVAHQELCVRKLHVCVWISMPGICMQSE